MLSGFTSSIKAFCLCLELKKEEKIQICVHFITTEMTHMGTSQEAVTAAHVLL